MNDTESKSSQAPARPPRRGITRYLMFVLVPLVLLLGAAAAAPALLSTDWGRSTALTWVNDTIPGEVSIGDLSLSWFGGQAVRELAVNDPRGERVLTLQEFSTDMGLLAALSGSLSMGQTVVRDLDAELVFSADGTVNLAQAFGAGGGASGGEGGLVLPVTGNMALIDSRIAVSAPGIETVVIDKLSGAVEMTGTNAPIRVSFGGQSRQGALQGSITFNGQISDWHRSGKPDLAAARINAEGSVVDLPLDAVDRLANLDGLAKAALGETASLDFRARGSAETQEIDARVQAPNATLAIKGRIASGRFTLQEPASVQLTLTPRLIQVLQGPEPGESSPRLAADVPLSLTVEALSIPVEDFSIDAIAMRAGLDARQPMQFIGIRELGEITLDELRMVVDTPALGDRVRVTLNGKPTTRNRAGSLALDADIRNLLDSNGRPRPGAMTVTAKSTISGIPTTLVDNLLQQDGLLIDAAGPEFGLDLAANTTPDGTIEVTAELRSDRLDTGPLRLVVSDYITLADPATIRLSVAPGVWSRVAGAGSARQLGQAAELRLQVTDFRMPVPVGTEALSPADIRLRGTISSSAITLVGEPETAATHIEGLRLDIDAGSLEALALKASANILQEGGLTASLDASPLQLNLDARTGFLPDLSPGAINATLTLESDGLSAGLDTRIEKDLGTLSLSKPATINVRLTPALLANLQDNTGPAVRLGQAANARIHIEQLTVPLAPFGLDAMDAAGRVELDDLTLVGPDGTASKLAGVESRFEFAGADRGRLQLEIDGQVVSGENNAGELTLAVAAGSLLNADGIPGSENLTLDVNGRLAQLPSALLDQLMGMDGLLVATLGPTADIDLSSELENARGPVSIRLNAPNARADIEARVQDQAITLSRPLVAELEPSPEFGSKVLSKIHPVLETTQRAERPIRFEVPPDGVLIPLDGFEFARIRVPRMTLDFGRLVLKSGWVLRGIVSLGRQFGKLQSVEKDERVVWFTPGVLSIRDGRIFYDRRLDLLLDQRLHLATWGVADVSQDESNLVLAFMPETLQRVFSITAAEGDALHIPIRGPLSGPRMDFETAAADLARLRAQEEVSGENPLAGALLGAIGGKVTHGGGPIPDPSVTPLPWADLLEAQDQAERPQAPANGQNAADGEPAPGQAEGQAPRGEQTSAEEQLIKGLIDIFGDKKKE